MIAVAPTTDVALTAGELLLLRQRLVFGFPNPLGVGAPAVDSALDAKLHQAQTRLSSPVVEPFDALACAKEQVRRSAERVIALRAEKRYGEADVWLANAVSWSTIIQALIATGYHDNEDRP